MSYSFLIAYEQTSCFWSKVSQTQQVINGLHNQSRKGRICWNIYGIRQDWLFAEATDTKQHRQTANSENVFTHKLF